MFDGYRGVSILRLIYPSPIVEMTDRLEMEKVIGNKWQETPVDGTIDNSRAVLHCNVKQLLTEWLELKILSALEVTEFNHDTI